MTITVWLWDLVGVLRGSDLEGINTEVSIEIDIDGLVSVLVRKLAVASVDISGFSITELKLEDVWSAFNWGFTGLGNSAFVDRDDLFADTGISVDVFFFGSINTDEESVDATPFSPICTGGLADTAVTALVLITDVLTISIVAFSDSCTLL